MQSSSSSTKVQSWALTYSSLILYFAHSLIHTRTHHKEQILFVQHNAVLLLKSRAELKSAVDECLRSSLSGGKCHKNPIGCWDVSEVTNMNEIFRDANVFNQDISSWGVSKVTSMSGMFSHAYVFNQDLSSWDVSKVVSMDEMFFGAWYFDQDLSSWDVSKVTIIKSMFRDSALFNQGLSSQGLSSQGVSSWDVSS